MEQLLYGAAYYDEYMPYDRLEKDLDLMTDAGMNLIRIAESTWSTWEPRDGEFDFTSLHRVLSAAGERGISVIIGTPTYAIPPWLSRKYPDVLSDTHGGRCRYGHRQNFDITHPGYLFHAERIIRKLMEAVQGYDCVIGYQLDNETKPYDTCSVYAQEKFKALLMDRYKTVEALNKAMGFAYWSNSLGSWDDLPDVRGTINASFGSAYQSFQRQLVTDFFQWQRKIVDEYRRPEQFVTHNFDYQWRNISYGYQPEVDQFEAAKHMTIAGCDIYHPSEQDLTGATIAFGGNLARGLKKDNYLVLETESQGNFGWLPYPNQLLLQAYSHFSSGANCVEYWNWHSIHNSFESYWKGVLSHDLEPNETYREVYQIGHELKRLSSHLVNLKKKNKIAVMVSNLAQTGTNWFPTCVHGGTPEHDYSDYLRWICDALYMINVEYDIIGEKERDFSGYDAVLFPTLYACDSSLIESIRRYTAEGGHVVATFRSFFANEELTIHHGRQPYGLTDVFGMTYDRFTKPVDVTVSGTCLPDSRVMDWMELLEPTTADVLAHYVHRHWGGAAAVTCNSFGDGEAVYLGCRFDRESLECLLNGLFIRWNIHTPVERFPIIRKEGINGQGKRIVYMMNYSDESTEINVPVEGIELRTGETVQAGDLQRLNGWDVMIFEEH